VTDLRTRRPAAFLDRDGTMILERDFLGDPDGVEILPGVVEAIQLLNEWGYWVIGVSNQSGVARGYFGTKDVEVVNERIIDLLAKQKAYVNQIYYCPHQPDIARQRNEAPCECRKPAPGMIRHALGDYPIDLAGSFVAGDSVVDIGLAHAMGIPGLLVLTGYGLRERELLAPRMTPDVIADDLLAAVRWLGQKTGHISPGN
jgi:histidinol-phosphate phosphatase family protein